MFLFVALSLCLRVNCCLFYLCACLSFFFLCCVGVVVGVVVGAVVVCCVLVCVGVCCCVLLCVVAIVGCSLLLCV